MAIEVFVGQHGPYTKTYWGTAPPSAATDLGPYMVGDIMWNTTCAAGGVPFWLCTTAGATGAVSVWKAAGVVAS